MIALNPGEATVTAILENGGQIEIIVKVSSESIILLDIENDGSPLDIDGISDGDIDIETDIELPGA